MQQDNTDIFNALVDIMTQAEFSKAQTEFFEKNHEKFSAEEENKLEYTNIHTEYVYMLDNVVEANLMEKFTNE
jgi:hypothetical protein